MKQNSNSIHDKIQTYELTAMHYYENSKETLSKKEFSKSGELLWGSIAEIAKALHLKETENPINSHSQIKEYLSQLSTIYRKDELKKWKNSAELLHVNFYETHLDEPAFMEHYNNALKLYAFLLSKLKSKKI